MAKDKSMYIRIDLLTELLIGHLSEKQQLNKSEVVRKAIYYYALSHVSDEDFTSLVQLATDSERS